VIIISKKSNDIYCFIKKNRLTVGVLVIIFAILLILNSKTLYTADDYVYRFVYHLHQKNIWKKLQLALFHILCGIII